jgi:predicted extracellular nuclease
MLRSFLFAALFALFSAEALAQNSPMVCDDGKCIQIGSYNLELFGLDRADYDGVDRGDRSEAELDSIVTRIATTLDLEVVVFQEINTQSDQWTKLKGKLGTHGYKFFEGTHSDRKQFVVLAWDDDEVKLQEPAKELAVRDDFSLSGGCSESGLRTPVAGRFKAGEFDFWVIGVHLKSRSGTPDCTTKIRREQCKDLKEKIDEMTADGGEKDVIIVGDYNEKPGHDSFKPLTDAGFTSQMKFLMPTSAKGSYIKNSGLHQSDDLIDQIMIRYSDTKEVVPNSAYVLPIASASEAKDYIIKQSDHVPACVSFRIDVDRD